MKSQASMRSCRVTNQTKPLRSTENVQGQQAGVWMHSYFVAFSSDFGSGAFPHNEFRSMRLAISRTHRSRVELFGFVWFRGRMRNPSKPLSGKWEFIVRPSVCHQDSSSCDENTVTSCQHQPAQPHGDQILGESVEAPPTQDNLDLNKSSAIHDYHACPEQRDLLSLKQLMV